MSSPIKSPTKISIVSRSTAMAKPNQQLFHLFVLLLPVAINGSDYITQQCRKNFTNNAVLQDNMNRVVSDLVAKTPAHGFAKSNYGDSSNAVYGLSECRGDIDGQACSACVAEAAREIRATCPNSAESRIWYHHCFLRYENDDFIGKSDVGEVGGWYSGIAPTDPQSFTGMVDELMDVVGKAAVHRRSRSFAWGRIDERNGNGGTIYGMVQCTSDLDQSACTTCLNEILRIRSTANWTGCYYIALTCSFRFQVDPFLNAPDASASYRSLAISSL